MDVGQATKLDNGKAKGKFVLLPALTLALSPKEREPP